MAGKTKGRINIPKDASGMLDLADKVYLKHVTDGKDSPLSLLEDHSWASIGPNIEIARAKHKEAEDLKSKMEQAYADRDLLMPDIKAILRASGTLLKGKFSKNPRKLGDWGYVVDDTPPVKKVKDDTGVK